MTLTTSYSKNGVFWLPTVTAYMSTGQSTSEVSCNLSSSVGMVHVSDSESEENSKNFDESADNSSLFTNSSKKGRSRHKKKVFSMQEEEEEGRK